MCGNLSLEKTVDQIISKTCNLYPVKSLRQILINASRELSTNSDSLKKNDVRSQIIIKVLDCIYHL